MRMHRTPTGNAFRRSVSRRPRTRKDVSVDRGCSAPESRMWMLSAVKNVVICLSLLALVGSCASRRLSQAEGKQFWSYEGLNSVYGKHPEVCPIHHVPLVESWSYVAFGLPAIPSAYKRASLRSFPCSYLEIWTGACTGTSFWCRTDACPKCRQAEVAWRAMHGWSTPPNEPGK